MNREDALRAFASTSALRDAWTWNFGAHQLLTRLVLALQQLPMDSEASKRGVYPSVLRMRRYLLALSRLSWQQDEEKSFGHAIDGQHAVHKSLFETYVEYGLCLVYLEKFGTGKDANGLDLSERLALYADTVAKKKNRQGLYRRERWDKLYAQVEGTFKPSPSLQAVLDQSIGDAGKDIERQAEILQGKGTKIGDLRHWFPEKSLLGEYFVPAGDDPSKRPRSCGSMEWRCKAVLGPHSPDAALRDWWLSAYDNDYDLLNHYTHPALGYDDSFRETPERLLDFAQMQLGMRFAFHRTVLPSLRAIFREVWVEFLDLEEQLSALDFEISKGVLPYLSAVHQMDRTP